MDNMTALRNEINSAYMRVQEERDKLPGSGFDQESRRLARELGDEYYRLEVHLKGAMKVLDRLAGMGK